jgi:hydrogenase maturation protease
VSKNLIVGLGNILLSDEGIGVHIVKELEYSKAFPGSQYLDLGTSSYELVNFINSKTKKIILLDCLYSERMVPGAVVELTVEDIISGNNSKLSLHQMKLIDTLKLISIDFDTPEILIVGIVPFDNKSYSTNISDELEKIKDSIVDRVKSIISEFLENR